MTFHNVSLSMLSMAFSNLMKFKYRDACHSKLCLMMLRKRLGLMLPSPFWIQPAFYPFPYPMLCEFFLYIKMFPSILLGTDRSCQKIILTIRWYLYVCFLRHFASDVVFSSCLIFIQFSKHISYFLLKYLLAPHFFIHSSSLYSCWSDRRLSV